MFCSELHVGQLVGCAGGRKSLHRPFNCSAFRTRGAKTIGAAIIGVLSRRAFGSCDDEQYPKQPYVMTTKVALPMTSSECQAQRVQRDQVDDILPAFWEWLKVQESRWRNDTDKKKFHLSPSRVAGEPLLQRSSVGKRVFRTLACGFIIVIVGGALAWQSSDDGTKDIVRNWEISLIRVTSLPRTNSPTSSDVAAEPASKSSDQAPIPDNPQTAPVNRVTPVSLAARSSAELQHHLESIGNDIIVVRRIVDWLAARQQQMAQDIATLQLTEQIVIERLSSLPQSTTVHLPQRQNLQRIVQSEGVVQSNSVHIRARPAQPPLQLH
jgi:hypothetical protein